MKKIFQYVIALVCFIICALSFGCGNSASNSLEDITREIKKGDAAFKAHDYDEALSLYTRAHMRLANLVKFEANSPSKDDLFLQRAYNINTFIILRIELSMIARDIPRQLPNTSIIEGQ